MKKAMKRALIVAVVAIVTTVAQAQTLTPTQTPTQTELHPLPWTSENVLSDQIEESIKGVVHVMCPDWQGSGFVVGPRLIVTARHVVEDVENFTITTYDGHTLHATRAISDKKHDVGFIWLDDLVCTAEKEREIECQKVKHEVVLHRLALASIKDCRLGRPVYVIGSPYGKINFNAVTLGIISGVDRDWSFAGDEYGWKVAFTIDAAGHPGNSGCPVFTMDGRVRGILVGGFSPVLIDVMPSDLFLGDLGMIQLMFALDKYEREEAPTTIDPYEYTGYEWSCPECGEQFIRQYKPYGVFECPKCGHRMQLTKESDHAEQGNQ